MIQINPGQQFPIVRQLEDPNDSSTLYVQAVVRNSLTGVVLNTVNLTDQGSHRFMKTFVAPGDPSNMGLFTDITTLVFTDASYATPSSAYGQVNDTYLVQQRVNPFQNFGGGGNYDGVTKEEVEKIIMKALATLKFPEYKATKIDPIIESLERVEKVLSNILDKDVDLSGLEQGLTSLSKALKAVDSRFPSIEGNIGALMRKETDITPILSGIESVMNRIAVNHNSYSTSLKTEVKTLLKEVSSLVDNRLLDRKKFNENKKRVKAALEGIMKGEDSTEEENFELPKPPAKRDFSEIVKTM